MLLISAYIQAKMHNIQHEQLNHDLDKDFSLDYDLK